MTKQSKATYYSASGPARAWEPDLDVGGLNHLLFNHGDHAMAGIWRADQEHPSVPVEVEIPARETMIVLEGTVAVTVDGGEPRVLRQGDMLSIPAQARVGWNPADDCVVFWTYS